VIAVVRSPAVDRFRRRTGTRLGSQAVRVRRGRLRRRRYAVILRAFAVLGAITICVVAYLWLVANVTNVRMQISDDVRVRQRLIDRTTQLEDKIARLDSRESLAKIATRLGMHEPSTFALVTVPADRAREAPRGVAFLPWLR
jgi:cell division protein FtsB